MGWVSYAERSDGECMHVCLILWLVSTKSALLSTACLNCYVLTLTHSAALGRSYTPDDLLKLGHRPLVPAHCQLRLRLEHVLLAGEAITGCVSAGIEFLGHYPRNFYCVISGEFPLISLLNSIKEIH